MANSDFSHPPRTPSPHILTPQSDSCNVSGDLSTENSSSLSEDKHPISRKRITAGSAAAKELGALFRTTQDKLAALSMKTQSFSSTVSEARSSTEESLEYQSYHQTSLPLKISTVHNPRETGGESKAVESAQHHEEVKQGDGFSPEINDPVPVFDGPGNFWEFPMQTILSTSSSTRDTISLSPQSTLESYGTPNTSICCPVIETASSYVEAKGPGPNHGFEDPFTDDQSALQRSHCCSTLGFTSFLQENIFGCADTEIRIVYDSEACSQTCFWVCAERMKNVSHKWASSRSFSQYTSRMPSTIVINSDSHGVIDAARYLFSIIHDSEDWCLPPTIRSNVLSRMVAISIELGCKSAMYNAVDMFLSSFADQNWEDLVEWDLHYGLYLAMQFRHDTSFQMISRSLAVFCPPRDGNSSPALWAGKITEPFVHIAIVPVLQAIHGAYSHAVNNVILGVENFLFGTEHGLYLDDSLSCRTHMDTLTAARRQLRRGLVLSGLWPLEKLHSFSLQSFVAEIKEAGEADPDVAGTHSECHVLEQLFEDLDDIVNGIEFSLYRF